MKPTTPPPFNPPRPLPLSSAFTDIYCKYKTDQSNPSQKVKVSFELPDSKQSILEDTHVRPCKHLSERHFSPETSRIIKSLPNFRDLGGHLTVGGQFVRVGMIYRGASINKISSEDIPYFIDGLGMKTLIDLRHKPDSGRLGPLAPYYHIVKHVHENHRRTSSDPLSSQPDINSSESEIYLLSSSASSYSSPISAQEGHRGVCYPIQLTSLRFYFRFIARVPARTWCGALSDVFCCRIGRTKARIGGSVLTPIGLEGLYRMFLDASKHEILKVLRLYTRSENYPIVVYCNHGKDRTGIIVALVLSICNVSLESIILNYSESHHHLTDWDEEIRHDFASTGVDPDEFATTPQEVMCGTINYIKATYGSIKNYLERIGLTEKEQQQIRNILLEDNISAQSHDN